MKETDLKFLGFTKKGNKRDGYWYELKFKNHRFITNDDSNAKDTKKWFVGYEDKKDKEQMDVIWFSGRIDTMKKFIRLFNAMTDHYHSLNGVHIKIKD